MSLELTSTGLTVETLDEIRSQINAAATDPTTGISPDLDTSDEAVLGRLFGLLAEREESLQQQIAAVYQALGVDATGVALQRVALLTGTVARQATYSTVELALTLAAGVTVPAGKQVASVGDDNVVFMLDAPATNGTGMLQVIYANATAIADGPVQALPNTLTVILDPVSGWSAVNNETTANLGKEAEGDTELRIRRLTELNRAASANLTAIVTDVKGVTDVLDARGYENTTATTNAAGMPPHSFEIVIYAPSADDDEVAQAIWDAQPAGIAAVFGGVEGGTSEEGDAVDVEGLVHPTKFTQATVTTIWLEVDLTKNPIIYPADGDTQVQSAVVNAINAQGRIGAPVQWTRLFSPIYAVPGIIDVTEIRLGTASNPTGTVSVAVQSRAIGRTTSGQVEVTSVDGVP